VSTRHERISAIGTPCPTTQRHLLQRLQRTLPRNHPQHLHRPRQRHLLQKLQRHPHRHLYQLHRHHPRPRHQFRLRRHRHKFNKDMGKCYFCGGCFRRMESNFINNDFPNLARNACTSARVNSVDTQTIDQERRSFRNHSHHIGYLIVAYSNKTLSILFITAVLSSKMEAESKLQVLLGISRSIS
jgi:hypothetical protein